MNPNIFFYLYIPGIMTSAWFIALIIWFLIIMVRFLRQEKLRILIVEQVIMVLIIYNILFLLNSVLPSHPFILFRLTRHMLIQVLLLVGVFGFYIYQINFERQKAHQEIAGYSIHQALDNLPMALSFSNRKGEPILTNATMQTLSLELHGHIFRNAHEFWQDIQDYEHIAHEDLDHFVIKLKDNQYWSILKEGYHINGEFLIQISGTNVSKQYQLSEQLHQENLKLNHQQARLKVLVDDIEMIKKDEETLALKMRIHNELGKTILTSKRYLEHETNHTLNEIIHYWNQVIDSMELPQSYLSGNVMEMYEQIKEAADMIGCELIVKGDFPSDSEYGYLMMIAIKEAIINAIKHGSATQVVVDIDHNHAGYQLEIYDNGSLKVNTIHEGGGLSSLRQKLEAAGGSLEIKTPGKVVLNIDLPFKTGEVI